jgi:hypothetical protein
MNIKISNILPIENQKDYKIHLACWNGKSQPLDVFVSDLELWKKWNSYVGSRDHFSREFIFSLIDFFPEKDTWLFGGVYHVLKRGKKFHSIQLVKDGSYKFIGRLKVTLKRPGRVKAVYLEKHYKNIVVSEILKESYSGERFCGYENINHDFTKLEGIFVSERPDWRAALENVKAVYVIYDKKNGKKYVGSAYGEQGLWSRWACYIGTGHGWNDELTRLIRKKGIQYARDNFKFTILEHRSMKTDDKVIIDRESFWKEALLSRGSHGYNKN